MFVKNRFCHFRTFPWLLKKYAKSKQICRKFAKPCPPPPSATVYVLQYSSFWNRKAKSYGSKLQVTPTKLQVTLAKLQVTPTKLQVTLTKLLVTSTKLQVTRSKLTSLTVETNKL